MTTYVRRTVLAVAALAMFAATMNTIALVANRSPMWSLPVAFLGIPAVVWAWMALQRRMS